MITVQNRNVVIGILAALVAVLSALVIVTSIAQLYGLAVALILGQLAGLTAIGYVSLKAREQSNEMFCARLTVSK